jgi:hypothetical protein
MSEQETNIRFDRHCSSNGQDAFDGYLYKPTFLADDSLQRRPSKGG